jgi:chorismate lyase / 3-hydroxybenzoate synthase
MSRFEKRQTRDSMIDPTATRPASRLRVDYRELAPDAVLESDVLAAITFGVDGRQPRDPRFIRVPLEPLGGTRLTQVWTGSNAARLGQSGLVRYAEDGARLMGWLEVDEDAHGGLARATHAAYRALLAFHSASGYRHIWRMWNFIGDINAGPGDEERYRQFSLGRAMAFDATPTWVSGTGYPAATAVGTRDGRRRLLVCWLAGPHPGCPVENPRQVSAYRYPSVHGPAPPSFSRAMITPDGTLLVSGTASIVGHGSRHAGDIDAQLEETLRNLEAVASTSAAPGLARASRSPLLTVFLRRPADAARVVHRLREHYPASPGIIVLDAAICRAELLLEIECIG